MRNVRTALVALVALVSLVTFFVRVPLPTGGYLNIGDIAVVFAGLVLGDLAGATGGWLGAIAGGLGSALADIFGGFAVFAPVTLVAKGLEGGLAGLAAGRRAWVQAALLACGGLAMMAVYFIGETIMPNIGLQGALSELLPNLIQAVSGFVGGRLAFEAYLRVVHGSPTANREQA